MSGRGKVIRGMHRGRRQEVACIAATTSFASVCMYARHHEAGASPWRTCLFSLYHIRWAILPCAHTQVLGIRWEKWSPLSSTPRVPAVPKLIAVSYGTVTHPLSDCPLVMHVSRAATASPLSRCCVCCVQG